MGKLRQAERMKRSSRSQKGSKTKPTNPPRWWSPPEPPLEYEERLDEARKMKARKKQPKRVRLKSRTTMSDRRVVNTHTRPLFENGSRPIRLVELRPGEVVMNVEALVEAFWKDSPTSTPVFLKRVLRAALKKVGTR